MSKLKVAVLEDSPLLLEELRYMLRDTNLVDVVVCSQSCEEFIQKVKQTKVDALILDIDIAGDNMSGMDVAYHLKLPVLFASGKTKDNLEGIEDLTLEEWSIVEHLTKPIKKEKLERMLPQFIEQVQAKARKSVVSLSLKDGRTFVVPMNSVAYICSCTGSDGRSLNKEIHFVDRKPGILVDVSFPKLESIGFTSTQFIRPHQSYRVNVDHVMEYNRLYHKLIVSSLSSEGKTVQSEIDVSENYRSEIKQKFR
ncbi:MAG: response regulator [Flavobacteriales bacterium]|nr:response regulator [Flavobacteriales bacterium]